jgi:hypothetical protein
MYIVAHGEKFVKLIYSLEILNTFVFLLHFPLLYAIISAVIKEKEKKYGKN